MRERYKGGAQTTTYTCRLCDRESQNSRVRDFHQRKRRERDALVKEKFTHFWRERVRRYGGDSEIGEIVSLVIGKGWRFPIFIFIYIYIYIYLLCPFGNDKKFHVNYCLELRGSAESPWLTGQTFNQNELTRISIVIEASRTRHTRDPRNVGFWFDRVISKINYHEFQS